MFPKAAMAVLLLVVGVAILASLGGTRRLTSQSLFLSMTTNTAETAPTTQIAMMMAAMPPPPIPWAEHTG